MAKTRPKPEASLERLEKALRRLMKHTEDLMQRHERLLEENKRLREENKLLKSGMSENGSSEDFEELGELEALLDELKESWT